MARTKGGGNYNNNTTSRCLILFFSLNIVGRCQESNEGGLKDLTTPVQCTGRIDSQLHASQVICPKKPNSEKVGGGGGKFFLFFSKWRFYFYFYIFKSSNFEFLNCLQMMGFLIQALKLLVLLLLVIKKITRFYICFQLVTSTIVEGGD